MSARLLEEASYGPLVSVIPPDGELHATSKIDLSQRGKVPGLFRDGAYHGYAFTKTKVSAAQIEEWGASTGLLGDHFPGLDLDIDDRALAEAVQNLAEEQLGVTATRLSREPRRLLVYRTQVPFARMALVITYKEKGHVVEFLGAGRQYLVHGKHKSGSDYRWDGQDLWDYLPSELPEITASSAYEFLVRLKTELEGRGIECELIGGAKEKSDAPAKPQEDLEAPSMPVLTALVSSMPNPESWDRAMYVQMACAIRAAGAADEEWAKLIFKEWSSRWPGHTGDEAYDDKTWDSLSPPYRVGWGWLQELAAKHTEYIPAVDEFDAADLPEESLASEDHPQESVQVSSGPPSNDEHVVRTLIPLVQDALRYVPGANRWYTWEGYVWTWDQKLAHKRLVRDHLTNLASAWLSMGSVAPNKKQREPWVKAATKYQNNGGIKGVIELMESDLAIAPSSFDPDPWALNTPGPVIDLRSGKHVERDPALMFTRSTGVAPAEGDLKRWNQFLRDLTGGDKDLIGYLQKVCGYALTGDVSEKTLWFVWGSNSDTGKSTFIRVITKVLGTYADTVDASVFVGSTNRIPAELARLPGVRLVAATEPKSGHAWDEKRIKAITGGDTIECRFLYGQPFTYDPQFKILIVGNHEPEIENVDDAMLRRVHIVPFNRKVPREKQIENLAHELVELEGAAILNWMVQGCLRWQDEGLTPPTVVVGRTKEYADEENLLQQWISDECNTGEGQEGSNTALYGAWASWCRQRGEDAGGSKQFARKLVATGFKRTQLAIGPRRLRGSKGIALRTEVEAGVEEFTT